MEASFERAARAGDGWIAGGGGPHAFRQGAEAATAAWQRAGRDGAPRLLGLSYYSLGDDARAQADNYIHDYYAFAGPYADQVAASVATDADALRAQQHDFEAAGCDELIWFPCSHDPGQVELLARAALR